MPGDKERRQNKQIGPLVLINRTSNAEAPEMAKKNGRRFENIEIRERDQVEEIMQGV
jgi:hypothetical protein